ELALEEGRTLPEQVILLAAPSPESLAALPAERLLLRCWRYLFHARVHQALAGQLAVLSDREIEERFERLGVVAVEEAERVLQQEDRLLDHDPRGVYIELAASYLEMRAFMPTLVPRFFPALAGRPDVDELLGSGIEVAALLRATRLKGAPEHPAELPPLSATPGPLQPQPKASKAERNKFIARKLEERAEHKAATGNVVRAALLLSRAAKLCYDARAAKLRETAEAHLEQLVGRLQAALGLDEEQREECHALMPALLTPAARGIWPAEARLLYDLQKVCVDHERSVHALDPVGWLFTLGRRPFKRPLPGQREVRMLKHLVGARLRVPACRLDDDTREHLARLLDRAVSHAENTLRTRFRQLLLDVLEEVGLRPRNLPEENARAKLVEELLDRIVLRGYLNMGDLRDALSRNQLKLDDLSGPAELMRGDCLLQANARLARALDGVYHPGEIYLREQQRASSLLFGTPPGRWLTLYLLLPFGCAFVTLEGLQHLAEPVVALFAATEEAVGEETPSQVGEHGGHRLPRFLNPYSFTLLGLFLFAVMHVPAFRARVLDGLRASWRGLRWLVLKLPHMLHELPALRLVLDHPLTRGLGRWVLKPALIAAPLSIFLPLVGVDRDQTLAGFLVLTVIFALVVNSRLGRDLEESLTDRAVTSWRFVRTNIFLGLFWLIMDLFRDFVELCERFLYTVDEWLRFRSGEGQLALVLKGILSVCWRGITYVIRIFVNLFVEPTFNPIKHFPVVTVAAKLMLPFFLVIDGLFKKELGPYLGDTLARSIGGVVILFLPGLAGYLVWELKENWKLYAANRPRELRPVVIGHHGETMTRLLRPGIHSGTIPKLFARIRAAAREARQAGTHKRLEIQLEHLHHLDEAIHHFVERELLGILRRSRAMQAVPLELAHLHLTTDAVQVKLGSPAQRGASFQFTLAEISGRLVAMIDDAALLERLERPQRQAVLAALMGCYQLAGVEFVWEHVVEATGLAPFQIRTRLLPTESGEESLPSFRQTPITWENWVAAWQLDQDGKPVPDLLVRAANG
ncbi:MAG: hypothetical protein AB7K24_31035, partial [Gemmataceae bacterium]